MDEWAAEELRLHLKLITGIEMPQINAGAVQDGSFVFHLAQPPAADVKPLATQESRWMITAEGAWFYGDASGAGTGTLFAVYSFLEEHLGVTWIEPGDDGIVFQKQSQLNLKPGESSWVPELVFRKIRQTYRKRPAEEPVPERFEPFPEFWHGFREVANQRVEDDVSWQLRMRMGGSRPGGGHAFSKWWERFGETRIDYFALNKDGKREPVPLAKADHTNEWVKICVSNPAVAKQIVEDWLPAMDRIKYVNAGLNDGVENFCECEDCKSLDVRLEGENAVDFPPGKYALPDGRLAHLTDRYVHLANAVAREVKKHREDAMVSIYAYLTTLHPPRKLKLEPNIVVHIVPYVILLDQKVAKELIEGWREAGATEIAFRPNYHFKYHPMPLPIGIEKEMFDVFQVAYANGSVSADYDSLMGCWPLTGMADYVLAKAMAEPDKDFAHWENQYCSAFGEASEYIKAYHRHWRTEVWEGRLKPNLGKLVNAGRSGNFARGLAAAIRYNYTKDYKPEGCDRYYTEEDFDLAGELLEQAVCQPLTLEEKKRVVQLILFNHHSRLEHGAMHYRGDKGYAYSKALLEFRTTHHKNMNISWPGVFYVEDVWGDACNLVLAKQLEKYPLPWVETGLAWQFRLDPDNVGSGQKWQQLPWEEIKKWDRLRTDFPWNNPYRSETDPELIAKLKGYEGIGWYATQQTIPNELKGREIYLHFGAVDDSCWIYVNGELVGEHSRENPDERQASFEIQIDKFVNWDLSQQQIVIRVEGKTGSGGISERVWLVSKD
ncbi:MAG: hypothetical protein ACI8UO_004692 [Verrucomicrobiales bacterium]|jgi:hypothetical protein